MSVILLICCIFCALQSYPVLAVPVPDNESLPDIIGFSVTPSSVKSGASALLAWEVSNANTIYIDHGIGAVAASGKLQISPPYSTTYKIIASNQAGLRTRYITIYVELNQNNASNIINVDPVTGRNSSVDLSWQDYCLSNQYQVQIARDPYFTLKVYDSGAMDTADSLFPAMSYPPGNLEAGHTYYWRVRVTRSATGQRVLSHWSEPMAFTVKPGYAVRSDYEGIHAFNPYNGCEACPVKPVSFSWSGYQDITKYRFILARDPELQDIIVEAYTSITSFAMEQALEYDTSYFWQVMAVEPVPSDASPLFTFHTEQTAHTINPPAESSRSEPPAWAVAAMIIGILLISAALFFIVRTKTVL